MFQSRRRTGRVQPCCDSPLSYRCGEDGGECEHERHGSKMEKKATLGLGTSKSEDDMVDSGYHCIFLCILHQY